MEFDQLDVADPRPGLSKVERISAGVRTQVLHLGCLSAHLTPVRVDVTLHRATGLIESTVEHADFVTPVTEALHDASTDEARSIQHLQGLVVSQRIAAGGPCLSLAQQLVASLDGFVPG